MVISIDSPTISCEFVLHSTFRAPTSLANNNPAMSASYSAWLLDVWNLKRNDCSICMFYGPSRTIPALPPFFLEEPSTCSVHVVSGSWHCCNSDVKSTKHWDLIGPCGSYLILNSDNSTDQPIILPANSGFCSILLIGKSSHYDLVALKVLSESSRSVNES